MMMEGPWSAEETCNDRRVHKSRDPWIKFSIYYHLYSLSSGFHLKTKNFRFLLSYKANWEYKVYHEPMVYIEPSLHCTGAARSVCWCLISDVNSLGGDGLCLKSCVNLDFVRVTNTLFIRQLLWLMYGLLWHEAEINKTTTTSDGKPGANFLAPGTQCSPKLSWACAETSIRRDVMLTVMWVKQTSILRSTHK